MKSRIRAGCTQELRTLHAFRYAITRTTIHQPLTTSQLPVHLPHLCVGVRGTPIGSDHVVGAADLLLDRQLRSDARARFVFGQLVPLDDTPQLRRWLAGDDDDGVEVCIPPGLV